MKNKSTFRTLATGARKRTWSAAQVDHRAEPAAAPAPRPLHWRLRLGSWADQPRSWGDQHRRRAHMRRQQKKASAQFKKQF